MAPRIAVIILAAGKSLRMGQPKMVLPWGSTTVLGRVVQVVAQAGIHDILVITGGDRQIVEAEAARLSGKYPVRSIYNEKFDTSGMISSIQAGIRALSPNLDAILIALGDQPQIEPATISQVIACYEQTKAEIVVPSYNNRRGHPVLIDIRLLSSLEAFSDSKSLRDYLNTTKNQIRYINADETILQDLDTPMDYRIYSKGKD